VAKWNKRKLFVRCLRPIRHYPRRDRHSSLDAPAEVIARARIKHPGNPPITFEITYEPSRINPSHRYAMRAHILVDGKLFFTTGRGYPVFTEGQSNAVALLLRRAGASTSAGGYKAEHTVAATHLRFLITNCDRPASQVFAFYNDRGECENRIQEFKNGFRADR